MKKIGLIVPCFNEEEILLDTLNTLSTLFDQLVQEKLITPTSFIACIDDGSRDATWSIINANHKKYVCGAKLSRNCGHQNAVMAGIESYYQHADALISIDADLQDDIVCIKAMIEEFIAGSQIVYGVRKSRKKDSFFKRVTAQGFYKTMKWMGVKTIYNHADCRLMSQQACHDLLQYPERNLFLRAIIPLIGYKTSTVYYDRLPRLKGESKYPLKKMLAFAWNGITSFSNKPIVLVRKLGQFGLFWSLMTPIVFTILYFTNVWQVSQFAILINVIAFATFLIIFCLGIVGEYVGKIYQEVKQRPRYKVETTLLPIDE